MACTLAKRIRMLNENAIIVLIGNDIQKINNILPYGIHHILLEPFSAEQLRDVIFKVKEINENVTRRFYYRHFQEEYFLDQDKISYFEKEKRKVYVHGFSGTMTFYMTVKEIFEQLGERNFCRCHRSYIVNMNYIYRVKRHHLVLLDGKQIEIGREYHEKFRECYTKFQMKRS